MGRVWNGVTLAWGACWVDSDCSVLVLVLPLLTGALFDWSGSSWRGKPLARRVKCEAMRSGKVLISWCGRARSSPAGRRCHCEPSSSRRQDSDSRCLGIPWRCHAMPQRLAWRPAEVHIRRVIAGTTRRTRSTPTRGCVGDEACSAHSLVGHATRRDAVRCDDAWLFLAPPLFPPLGRARAA